MNTRVYLQVFILKTENFNRKQKKILVLAFIGLSPGNNKIDNKYNILMISKQVLFNDFDSMLLSSLKQLHSYLL